MVYLLGQHRVCFGIGMADMPLMIEDSSRSESFRIGGFLPVSPGFGSVTSGTFLGFGLPMLDPKLMVDLDQPRELPVDDNAGRLD